ncbi:hypothetical protein [Arachidicoccus terrestris]|uniref:hypothetical protein n=1 Tax=Arachidicoccus terrestris TaxID=2875539 RepID=UPI001CC3CE7B|nr:hypothetical protein [Arachidicoccus terrestris]UAY56655.1 hypothetical protein K9M52_06555 [Arachidicoccus terrestris]
MTDSKRLLFTSVIVACLASCGPGTPSAKDAQDKINQLNSKLPIEYTELKKTNGIKGEIEGKEVYEMSFTAKVVAKEDLETFQRFKPTGVDTMFIAKTDTAMLKKAASMKGGFMSMVDVKPLSSFKKGDLLFTRNGMINFVKTENGWR